MSHTPGSGRHSHLHQHPDGTSHAHEHGHKNDNQHALHDNDHVRAQAGPGPDEDAAIKASAGRDWGGQPEVLMWLSHTEEEPHSHSHTHYGDNHHRHDHQELKAEVPLKATRMVDEPEITDEMSLTAAELDAAEDQFLASLTPEEDLAADDTQGEIFRYSQYAIEDQLRSQGRRF